MGHVEVVPVQTGRQQRQFIDLAWDIYRGDPYWIPPLRQNLAEMVGFRHHPFQDYARLQPFLALRDGRPSGRIVALVNTAHNERYRERRGFLGFYECEPNTETSRALFGAAQRWLIDQGMTDVRGPCNPSLNHECGLLIDGFDSSPMFMMTYNPPYYVEQWEDAGLSKIQDLYAFWGHVNMIESLDPKLKFVIDEASRRFKIQLRQLDRSRFLEEVRMFLDIYNKSLVGTWGFVPMSSAEVDHTARALKYLIAPEMTAVAEVEGKPVGAIFGLLDYNPRIKQINGRLFPFGFIRLLWNRQAIQTVRLISTNVLPEYQRWGVGVVLLSKLLPEVIKWGIQEAEFSWVLETNHLSRASLERGGAKLNKTYRIYDAPLPLPGVPL
ncbi:MAG: GNAT family N-acetyltransferase [Pirellulales bacterium]